MQKDVEAEMKRLKLELKQTMDMYNTACKEAVSAKKKVFPHRHMLYYKDSNLSLLFGNTFRLQNSSNSFPQRLLKYQKLYDERIIPHTVYTTQSFFSFYDPTVLACIPVKLQHLEIFI